MSDNALRANMKSRLTESQLQIVGIVDQAIDRIQALESRARRERMPLLASTLYDCKNKLRMTLDVQIKMLKQDDALLFPLPEEIRK